MGDHAEDTMNWDDHAADHYTGDGGPGDQAIDRFLGIPVRRKQGSAYIDESEDAELGQLGESVALKIIRDTIAVNGIDADVFLQWPTTKGWPIRERISMNREQGDIVIAGPRGKMTVEVKSTRKYAAKGTVSFPSHCFEKCKADLLFAIGFREDDTIAFSWHRTMKSVRDVEGAKCLGDFWVVAEGPGFDLDYRLERFFGTI